MRMMVRADVGYNPDQLSAAAIHPRLSAIGHAVVFGPGEDKRQRFSEKLSAIFQIQVRTNETKIAASRLWERPRW